MTRAAEVCRGSRSGPGLVALLSLNRTHVPLGGEEEEGRRGGEPKDVTRWVSGVPPMGPSSVIQRMYKQGPSGRGKASLGASLEETQSQTPGPACSSPGNEDTPRRKLAAGERLQTLGAPSEGPRLPPWASHLAWSPSPTPQSRRPSCPCRCPPGVGGWLACSCPGPPSQAVHCPGTTDPHVHTVLCP